MTEKHSPPADTAVQWGAIDPFDTADPYLWIRLEHLGRYLFALDYLREKGASRVLDAGAGTGYGCRLLAASGLHVTCLDIDVSRIRQWASQYSSLTVRAVIADLERGIDDDATYDAVVMFEVLEHMRDPVQHSTA